MERTFHDEGSFYQACERSDWRLSWIVEVQEKARRKNQMLFSKESAVLQELILLIAKQNHRTMVLWAFEFADEMVRKLVERYPGEPRPGAAVAAAKEWASGEIKMPAAKQAILQVHALAKEIDSPEDIALCHAVGQACGVVHANGHALGFPIYDLTAIVRRCGVEHCVDAVEERVQNYIERIYYWQENYEHYPVKWAGFMLRD